MALEINNIFSDLERSKPEKTKNVVTDIKEAVRDRDRLNIFIDNKFYCSLALSQLVDLKIKIGNQLSEEKMAALKRASEFGKLYQRALEYALMRPHSSKEMRDYLNRKTLDKKVRVKDRKTGEYKTVVKQGADKSLVEPVMSRLCERGYVDDERFAKIWLENRSLRKGASAKKLKMELRAKGVSEEVIERCVAESPRDERAELRKTIERKAKRYQEEQKLIQYLLRQGFNYSDILDELSALSLSE